MDELPAEVLCMVREWADPGTKRVLACISHRWNALSKAQDAMGGEKVKSCSDDGRVCRLKQRCAVKYASRMAQQRRWKVLEWMLDLAGPFGMRNRVDELVCTVAAEDSDVARLGDLVEKGYRWDTAKVSEGGAQYGHRKVVKWARAMRGRQWTVCEAAMKGGRLEMVEWAHEKEGYALSSNVVLEAAKAGRIDALEWLASKNAVGKIGCIRGAMMGGHVAAVEWLLTVKPKAQAVLASLSERWVTLAARGGHQVMIEWLHERWIRGREGAMKQAIKSGHHVLVECMRQQGHAWNKAAAMGGARRGNLSLLKRMMQEGCPWDGRVFDKAAKGGHVEVMEWAWNEGLRWWEGSDDRGYRHECDKRLMAAASQAGQLEAVMWLAVHGCEWNAKAYKEVIRKGHVHVAAWARRQRWTWNLQECITAAVESEDVDMLEWIKSASDEKEWRTEAVDACCKLIEQQEQLAMAEWFLVHGGAREDAQLMARIASPTVTHVTVCTCDMRLCSLNLLDMYDPRGHGLISHDTRTTMTRDDRVKALMWLRERGCAWDARVCTAFALQGNLSALQWARGQGCPWDADTCFQAVSFREMDVLEWAVQNGCPWDERTIDVLAYRGMHKMVEWMRSVRMMD